MTLKNIKNAIQNYLEEIAGTDEKIRKIYGYFEPVPTEFPCAMVYLQTFDEERLDFGSNTVNADFIVKLCIPQPPEADYSVLEDLRLDCVQSIVDKLNSQSAAETLGGVCYSAIITTGEPEYDNETAIPTLVTGIVISTKSQKFLT